MKIKFIVETCRWRDKVNGNSYFSCLITRTDTGEQIRVPFSYGYGNQNRADARKKMLEAGWIDGNQWYYEHDNEYPIYWACDNFGTKMECIDFGKEA